MVYNETLGFKNSNKSKTRIILNSQREELYCMERWVYWPRSRFFLEFSITIFGSLSSWRSSRNGVYTIFGSPSFWPSGRIRVDTIFDIPFFWPSGRNGVYTIFDSPSSWPSGRSEVYMWRKRVAMAKTINAMHAIFVTNLPLNLQRIPAYNWLKFLNCNGEENINVNTGIWINQWINGNLETRKWVFSTRIFAVLSRDLYRT